MKRLPQVLILYTGGTFGMDLESQTPQKNSSLSLPTLSPQALKKRFLNQVPELSSLAHCHVEILFNLDSSHIGPFHWVQLSQFIQNHWKSYEGIVILHGTDTLAYTASALSLLLTPCPVPIVITGAQRPLSAYRTDARSNLISAVEIAAHGPRNIVNQVTVFFGNKLFQGNRIRKMSAGDFDAFDSPHLPPLGIVGTTIRYTQHTLVEFHRTHKLRPIFNQNVLLLHVTPGMPSHILTQQLLSKIQGIVLVVFHSWTAPTCDSAFLQFLQKAHQQKIPVVVATEDHSTSPSSLLHTVHYPAGKSLLHEHCFFARAMTLECTYVKTQLLLGQSTQMAHFKRLWKKDFAGEGCTEAKLKEFF